MQIRKRAGKRCTFELRYKRERKKKWKKREGKKRGKLKKSFPWRTTFISAGHKIICASKFIYITIMDQMLLVDKKREEEEDEEEQSELKRKNRRRTWCRK